MSSLEAFDKDVKDLVNSSKLSSSRIKAVTDAAMANISSDAHIVATLFKVHKQAKSTHKISSLYVIDAIAREARQQVKKAAKGKQTSSSSNTPLPDGPGTAANDDSDDLSFGKRKSPSGTFASFLTKIESFLDRLVLEVLTKGPPEHKDKVKKVVDIWKKSGTFSSEAMRPCYARLSGEVPETDVKVKNPHSKRLITSTSRSTTPPYPPPETPIQFPQFPPVSSGLAFSQASPAFPATGSEGPQNLVALLGSISASSLLVPPSNVYASQQPAVPNFESSQLALLQQLAAQTSATTSFGASPTPSQPGPPVPIHQGSESYPVPGVSVPSTSRLHSDSINHQQAQPVNNWSRAPIAELSSRERSPRREGRRPSQWDRDSRQAAGGAGRRRSASPPQERYSQSRQRGPPRRPSPPGRQMGHNTWGAEQDHGAQPARDSRPQRKERPRQQETRQIATYISEDRRDDRPAAKAKDNRYAFESDDFSSFEVRTTGNAFQANKIEANEPMASFPDQQWSQSKEASQAPDLLANAAAFNAASFNPLEPESWASFAVMCQGNIGRLPTNMEMMQWIMSSMAMMQASAAQMNGGDSMMGQQGMYGMMQGMHGGNGNEQAIAQQNGSSQGHSNGQSSHSKTNDQGALHQQHDVVAVSRESSIEPDRRPPPPSRDEGEGEADMQMTPEP